MKNKIQFIFKNTNKKCNKSVIFLVKHGFSSKQRIVTANQFLISFQACITMIILMDKILVTGVTGMISEKSQQKF
ncbi:MAG: hypothetical protein IPL26_11535 [Leptospiraceae bacterium]|nr:hypothetical protein [Leptospiraceae bacterium]